MNHGSITAAKTACIAAGDACGGVLTGGVGDGTQSILGYEVSCVLPIGTPPRRISQWTPPLVRTPPHASPAAMQAVLAAVMLP